MQYNLLFKLKF